MMRAKVQKAKCGRILLQQPRLEKGGQQILVAYLTCTTDLMKMNITKRQ